MSDKKLYLLKEMTEFNFITEADEKGEPKKSPYGNMMVKGILQRADATNQNGRIYPRSILEAEIENYKKLINDRRATGELDHCLDESSEILTTSGWKFLKDISDDEEIYSLNLETNNIEKHIIDRKIVKNHNDIMYYVTNGKKIDLVMTNKHNVLLWDRYNKSYKITAEEMYNKWINKDSKLSHSHIKNSGINYKAYNNETYTIPGTNFSMPLITYAGFLGLWMAEGHVSGSKTQFKNKNRHIIGITQKKQQNISLIQKLLQDTNIPFKEIVTNNKTYRWGIKNKNIHNYFFQFGNSATKFLPKEVFEWPTICQQELIKWMLLGDGLNRKLHRKGNVPYISTELATVSNQLANDFSHLLFLTGKSSYTKIRKQKDSKIQGRILKSENMKPLYIVSENITNSHTDSRFMKIEKKQYNGNVYCVTVKNNNFLTRRNGKVAWTGNCDSSVVNLQKVSHVITDIWWEGDTVMGKVEILEDMDQGRQLKALFKNGIKVGISSRAVGSVRNINGINYVEDDLQLICWDFVSEPSTHNAFMMQEARLLSRGEIEKLEQNSGKVSKINKIATELLGYKK